MAKTINTLVEDIYGLFSSDFSPSQEAVRDFGQKLALHLSTRISETRGPPTLRLSNLGLPCDRKLWYTINTPNDSEPLSPSTRIKFLFGDILEELLLFLAAQAGHSVEGMQDEVEISSIRGHRDAVIDGVTIDAKSASSQSFKKFESGLTKEEDPFGYLTQLNSYRYSSRSDPLVKDRNRAGFLVIDKQLGKITLDIHQADDVDYEKVAEEKKQLIRLPEPPPRPYTSKPEGKSGNMKLGTVCSYCSFKQKCWADSNNGRGLRTFLYSKGPVYLTEVHKEPNVIEIDSNNQLIERDI